MKRLVYLLLATQLVLVAVLLSLIADHTGDATAQGGQVTQLTLAPINPWTGLYGRLTPEGASQVTITAQGIRQQDIFFDNPQNECKRTELFAAVLPVRAQDITPITPQQADALLGFDPTHPYSSTSTYTTQEQYELAGNTVQLWSATTQGALTGFTQGIGQVNGTLVFVTKTVRNARAFNNEPAEYQFLLPAGTWQITYDETDECLLLDEMEQPEVVSLGLRLDVGVEQRVCVGQETRIAAVHVLERLLCRPHEWGRENCRVADQATLEVSREGTTQQITQSSGVGFFTPATAGQYIVRAQEEQETASRIIAATNCLGFGVEEMDAQTITFTRPDIGIGDLPPFTPREELPAEVDEQAIGAAYSLIAVLTITIVLLGLFAFFHVEEKARVATLKTRIWWLEHFRK